MTRENVYIKKTPVTIIPGILIDAESRGLGYRLNISAVVE
jgi:hypothetical protein